MKTSAYRPFEVSTKDRIVGIFVIGAILLFLAGFLIPFIQRFSDEEGLAYHTILDQTYGIAPDAQVSMRGLPIGNVTQIGLTGDGSIRVDFKLSQTYDQFYKLGSRLSLDSNIGINTLLSGSGLVLLPGPNNAEPLALGSYIGTDIPMGISEIIENLDIVQLSDQVAEIVANIEAISSGVNANQHYIYQSLANLEQITIDLTKITAELPKMLGSVDRSLASLETTMAGVNEMVTATNTNLQPLLQNTSVLTGQATETLKETGTLLSSAQPAIEQLPHFMATTQLTLQSITELTENLNNSWLLGGSGKSIRGKSALPNHPHDDSLYQDDYSATNQTDTHD